MLLDRHAAKITTPEVVLGAVGAHPRDCKVALCHGVFDIVHVGHLRHLSYVRSRCDVLVVSVTADRFVGKGPHRPHVPERLRAGSLAMLDIVDHVVINDAEKPLDLIDLLRPDYYAKGFEYSETARPGRTIEEAAVLESYGGEMMFTPGDLVRSSSALMNIHVPDLRYDKLKIVMEGAGVTFEDLYRVVGAMSSRRVHVVGDVIVDALTHCTVIGGQTKTPTLSVRRERSDVFVGGAGVVAKHVRAAGAEVSLATVVGNDDDGRFALDDLEAAGVRVDHVVDLARPTTRKEAIVAGGYRLLKVDVVDNRTISDQLLHELCGTVDAVEAGAVVYSDFRHGIFNSRTIPAFLVSLLSKGDVLKVADSQVASRWGNITEFRGFDLITPNEREARFALADQDSGIRPLASRLYDAAKCRVLMMKMGERGMLTCVGPNHEAGDSFFVVDSFADRVVDPVGAGDAVLAYATLALLVDPRPVVAAVLGSLAAGCACERDGNLPVTTEYVLEKIDAARRECSGE
jgi:rfaE bifunctional protein kinase chain/domain